MSLLKTFSRSLICRTLSPSRRSATAWVRKPSKSAYLLVVSVIR